MKLSRVIGLVLQYPHQLLALSPTKVSVREGKLKIFHPCLCLGLLIYSRSAKARPLAEMSCVQVCVCGVWRVGVMCEVNECKFSLSFQVRGGR